MPEPGAGGAAPAVVRRCGGEDWREVRRLYIRLALGLPVVVDVDLNEVLTTPDDQWRHFVHEGTVDPDQALFVAEVAARCVGMGHVRRQGRRARLAMLYVDADRRRGGIGGALVAAQERWALAAGIADLVCHIPDVSAAAGLAHASGWRRTDGVFVTRHGLEERKWVKDQRTAPVDPGGRPGG